MRRLGRLQRRLDRGSELVERSISLDGQIKSALNLSKSPLEWLWRGLIVAALTGLWGFVAYLTPKLNELGLYAWALAGLAGAVLLISATVFFSWSISKILSHWPTQAGGGAHRSPPKPESAPARAPAKVIRDPTPEPSKPTESEEESSAKLELAAFVAQHVLPAFEAQKALQEAAIHKLCGKALSVEKLAKAGLNEQNKIEDCHAALMAVVAAVNDKASNISFNDLMTHVDILSRRYHGYCSYAGWICRPAGVDYKTDAELSTPYRLWRERTERLEAEYRKFQSNPCYRGLYSLDQERRVGMGFVTDQ